MFDKKMFQKICDVTCTWEELSNFIPGVNTEEFDLDEPFLKYYDLETILKAIEKYQTHEINGKFLATWMNAYNWIIMGGFQLSEEKIPLKAAVIWAISDWLDSLSFFDDTTDFYDLESYKNLFSVLDRVIKDIDDCTAVYSEDERDDGFLMTLIVNDKANYFVKMLDDTDFGDNYQDRLLFPEVPQNELRSRVKQLQKQGYTELWYSVYADEWVNRE